LRLPVAVVKSQDSALFGLDLCRAWNMPLPKGVKLCKITPKALPNAQECTDIILKEFAEVFDTSKPGLMVDHPVQIHMNETAVPKAFPARVVPLPLRKGVEEELQRLVERDILEPVDSTKEHVDWASPIVTVVKPSGAVRICGDFKVTINKY